MDVFDDKNVSETFDTGQILLTVSSKIKKKKLLDPNHRQFNLLS